MINASLISSTNRVETPFIIVKIGDYTFGHYGKQTSNNASKVTFPKYVQRLNVTKVNGAINTYTIVLDYAITEYDDPNMLEAVFASVSNSRKIIISYGDLSNPLYMFKEEEALITKLQTNVSVEQSKITYTISCTSTSLALKSGAQSFNARRAKPSDVIIELFNDTTTGLQDIFRGMTPDTLSQFITTDDQIVELEAKISINVFDYISYLVKCMVSTADSSPDIRTCRYYWSVFDDISNIYGGTYFKVNRVSINDTYDDEYNTYTVDVGYPSGNNVTSFTVNNDDSWSILYNYSKQLNVPQYTYKINNEGVIESVESPSFLLANKQTTVREIDRAWWTNVTQFPINATLTIKGLLRPAMLMSFVRVNTYFYGKKHVSSGLYIITKQQDQIDTSGYRTTLSLTRIRGD